MFTAYMIYHILPSVICMLHALDVHFISALDIQTNECLENNGGCWQDKAANITACKVLPVVLFFFYLEILVYQIFVLISLCM
jgi:hypothetical protein